MSWIKAKIFIGLILTLALMPCFAWAAEKKLVRLTFSNGWDALPALVAIERGFFDQEQLVVSGLAATSSTAVMRSVTKRTTDFASITQRMLLVMMALKLPIQVVSMNGWGKKIELVVSKENTKTKSLRDLKGKTIAMINGSEALPVLIRLANRERMHPTEFKVKYLPANKITKAFQEKLVDAVFELKHFTNPLVQKGGGRLVIGDQKIVKSLGFIGASPLITSKAMIEKEPETVQKFVNAWVKALLYIRQDPKDAARLLQIFFHRQGIPVSSPLATSWVGMTRYDRFHWTSAEIADAQYNGWGLKEGGVLKIAPKLPKLKGYIENRFAIQALKKIRGKKPTR